MAAAEKSTGAPLPAKLASLLREAKWLILVAVAAYLLLILATYHKSDPGWSHSAAVAVTQNAGGWLGARLADILLYMFGVSAYWWAALCIYVVVWGYRRIDGKGLIDRRPLAIAFAGFVVLLLSSAALEALRLQSLPAELPLAAGGMIGQAVSRLATGVFGFTGATLALITLVAVGFSLFTGISWLAVSEFVGFALESVYEFVLRSWDRRKDRRLGEIAREERGFVVEAE